MKILEKNLLVLASAGSGKTYTLSDRIIGLMGSGVEPSEVVALTFTRKAAGEFAEAILNKLAGAADDPVKARILEKSLGTSGIDFHGVLRRLTEQLPDLTLGTMDQFFSRVVRAFQYELGVTGGKFELFEAEAAQRAKDEILEKLLGGQLRTLTEEELLHTFRRATAGSEGTSVLENMRKFVADWHEVYRSGRFKYWGPDSLVRVKVSEWEAQKHGLLARIERALEDEPDVTKRQRTGLEKVLKGFAEYRIGSGKPDCPEAILQGLVEGASGSSRTLRLQYHKPFVLHGEAAAGFCDLVKLVARCEVAAAVERTQGIYMLMGAYDAAIGKELRERGKLGFQDIKYLMGRWQYDEAARLQREVIDFRLDARYRHWLLDEFQDTSRDDWNGLLPLVDEAVTHSESSVFIVGDKKQGIYGWRGGEVGLFDELIGSYGAGLSIETMAQSWRSCPEVLSFVNQICGDLVTMRSLFGDAVNLWQWEDHQSALPLAAAENAGYARISLVDKDAKMDEVMDQLRAIGVGEKALTCGLLVNSNKEVKGWAEALRGEGFHVVEEGAREPAKDHLVGAMIWQLLCWLANPADSFALQAVKMSPLWTELKEHFRGEEEDVWEGVTRAVSSQGYSRAIARFVGPILPALTEFGQRRADDLVRALEDLDREGVVAASEVAYRIEHLKVVQSPGTAAVQIMTVHKAKGLGFDAVFLPEISSVKVPNEKHLSMLQGKDWVLHKPQAWIRTAIPELADAEERWGVKQRYETFCRLYVALTRAKRGLYVYLDETKSAPVEDHPSVANWILQSTGMSMKELSEVECGDPAWSEALPLVQRGADEEAVSLTGKAVVRRQRSTPSGVKSEVSLGRNFTGMDAREFGTLVHEAFERIGWIDGEESFADESPQIRELFEKTFQAKDIRALFEKPGQKVDLFREQRLEAIVKGSWISGVIDRLHVFYNDQGIAERVDVIDFKTDQVRTRRELKERHCAQMAAYGGALERIYPEAEVNLLLVSTYLCEVVPLGA